MILTGIVEDIFGGQLVFRGFSALKDLTRISASDMYQREIDETRLDEIIAFLKDNPFRFFPELIFGLQFEDERAISTLRQEDTQYFPSGANRIRTKFKFSDGITLKKAKFDTQVSIGESPNTKSISLEFHDLDKKYLKRIDGNHRLSAIDKILALPEDSSTNVSLRQSIGNTLVPFSILLQNKSDLSTKYETAYFYLINSRSVPLTTEQNLSAILKNPHFTKTEWINLLGNRASDIHKLANDIISGEYSAIMEIVNNNIFTFFDLFFRLLKTNPSIESIKQALWYVNFDYFNSDKLRQNPNLNILIALLYFRINEEVNYYRFKDWIVSNQLFSIKEVDPNNIIEIFKNTHKKGPYQVFVAMPYVSFKRVNEYNQLFKEVLKEIQDKEKVQLELIPIMRFRGASQRIDQRLIQKIKDCDIFIADLTECNDNVIFEVGLAEGNGKPMVLIKADDDKIKVPFGLNEEYVKAPGKIPFDMDKLQYIPYSSTGYYNDIKLIIKNNLPEILKVKYNEK